MLLPSHKSAEVTDTLGQAPSSYLSQTRFGQENKPSHTVAPNYTTIHLDLASTTLGNAVSNITDF